MRTIGRAGLVLVATISLVAMLASSANAREFRMTGKWLQQRGPNAQIPIFGGIPNKDGAMVSAMGTGTATLTIPRGQFTGMNDLLLPLPIDTIVQLSTMFTFSGPALATTSVGGTGVMRAGTKPSRPANFSYCKGAAANPACTSPAPGGAQGTEPGIVIYAAGPNQFGGTMQMLLTGGGSLSVVIGTSPTRIQHNLIGGGTMGGLQEQGGPYANMDTDFLPAGPITTGAVCARGTSAGNNGLIITAGVASGPPGTDSTNTNTGFPWTTGMVSAIVTTKLPTTNSTLTGTGSDMRTPLGAGNITLVAGGISHREPSIMHFASLDSISMVVKARNLPSMSPTGLAALATMITLGAGFASRKRWNRQS
jgi:hypothetical protein